MQYVYYETHSGVACVIPGDQLRLISQGGEITIYISPPFHLTPVMDSIAFFSSQEQAFMRLRDHAAKRRLEEKTEGIVSRPRDIALSPDGVTYRVGE